MMLGPVSSENEGAGSGIGRVRAFSLVIRACWCWRGGVVSAARARGLPGGWPYLLQDVRVCLLATLKQGNKSMYRNTSGYVHKGLRLDWGKGITGQ